VKSSLQDTSSHVSGIIAAGSAGLPTAILFLYGWLIPVLLGILPQCTPAEQDKQKKSRKNGLVTQYRKDGSLKTEIEYKNGKRHGLARSYYENGQLRQEITYENNVKHGEAKTYYQSGQLYQITPYHNGYIHGTREKYRMEGNLMAEVPYYYSSPCQGLMEYLLNGKRKKQYPAIEIEIDDQLSVNNQYIIRFSMSEKMKDVAFYHGTLDENGCMVDEMENIYSPRTGVGEITFNLLPGYAVREEFNIIAKGTTKLGSPYITQRQMSLAVENKGH